MVPEAIMGARSTLDPAEERTRSPFLYLEVTGCTRWEIHPNFSMGGFSKTIAYTNLYDWDLFMDALRKAGLK